MLKGHHGVCGERGEGRETDRLGIEQTSVAMSRHVAGDTDGRNSAGRRSFDCLQSPPPPSLAHRRRTRLGAAARRTVRVSQSCWGFRGLLDAGRESVPHLRRRPAPLMGLLGLATTQILARRSDHCPPVLRDTGRARHSRHCALEQARSRPGCDLRSAFHASMARTAPSGTPSCHCRRCRCWRHTGPATATLATRGHRAQKPFQRGR